MVGLRLTEEGNSTQSNEGKGGLKTSTGVHGDRWLANNRGGLGLIDNIDAGSWLDIRNNGEGVVSQARGVLGFASLNNGSRGGAADCVCLGAGGAANLRSIGLLGAGLGDDGLDGSLGARGRLNISVVAIGVVSQALSVGGSTSSVVGTRGRVAGIVLLGTVDGASIRHRSDGLRSVVAHGDARFAGIVADRSDRSSATGACLVLILAGAVASIVGRVRRARVSAGANSLVAGSLVSSRSLDALVILGLAVLFARSHRGRVGQGCAVALGDAGLASLIADSSDGSSTGVACLVVILAGVLANIVGGIRDASKSARAYGFVAGSPVGSRCIDALVVLVLAVVQTSITSRQRSGSSGGSSGGGSCGREYASSRLNESTLVRIIAKAAGVVSSTAGVVCVRSSNTSVVLCRAVVRAHICKHWRAQSDGQKTDQGVGILHLGDNLLMSDEGEKRLSTKKRVWKRMTMN